MFGCRHRLLVLPMRQVMAGTARAKAQRLHRAMHRIDTHHDTALARQQRLQVAYAPDGHRQVIRLGSALQRLRQEGPVSVAQCVRASTTPTIHQPRAAFGGKAFLPHVDAIGGGVEQARDTR
jgi:hypothetical protein